MTLVKRLQGEDQREQGKGYSSNLQSDSAVLIHIHKRRRKNRAYRRIGRPHEVRGDGAESSAHPFVRFRVLIQCCELPLLIVRRVVRPLASSSPTVAPPAAHYLPERGSIIQIAPPLCRKRNLNHRTDRNSKYVFWSSGRDSSRLRQDVACQRNHTKRAAVRGHIE